VFDIKLINGTVVDGSGADRYRADVGVADGRIVWIGQGESPDAHQSIDVTAKIVAPGFIDMHSHSDLRLLDDPPPIAKVSQGITAELLGQDGLGVAPITDDTVEELAGLTAGLLGPRPPREWRWRDLAGYMEVLDRANLPNNQAVLASHGPLRLMAVGADDREATAGELDTMKGLLDEAFQAGAVGLSTGMIYPPAVYAPESELVALTEVVARHDGVFVIHMRDESYYLLEAVEETLRVCRRSGCRLHISHLQAHGKVVWHLLPRVLEMLNDARADGMEITCDRYPYLAGSTVLSAVLPAWMLSGGPGACLRRLGDPVEREKVHKQFEQGLEVWNNRSITVGWENIVVSWVGSEDNRWAEGLNIREIADRRGTDPVTAAMDLLEEEELQVTMVAHYGSEENLERIYRQPWSTVGTDGIYGGRPHPRLWGSFSRFFGHYVRDRSLLSLEEAVHKVTTQPAEILRLDDQRGRLTEGHMADITVFDPTSIEGLATYEEPEQLSRGVDLVIVNGEVAWQKDSLVGTPGVVL